MQENQWLFIINPNAGVKKGTRNWPMIHSLLDKAGLIYEYIFTENRGHAIQLVCENIEKGYRNIAVVGGDGTLNEALNGIFEQKACDPLEISLGMIPVGTGNDWCRMFGIPFDYAGAVDVLMKKKTFLQDVGKVTFFRNDIPVTRYFMNVAGMGYDALVAKKTNLLKEKGFGGPLVYFYFIFTSLFQYKFMDAVIRIDEETIFNGSIFSMNVGICKYNGGGMMQVPYAIPDDGLLDVILIKKASKLFVIRNANKLYDGSHINLSPVKTFRGKTVKIDSPGKIYLEADGESLGHTPMSFEILTRRLKVIGNQLIN